MVADFWSAVDYIAEKNLDQEDAFEEAKAAAGHPGMPRQGGLEESGQPTWFQWRDKLLADYAAGKIPIVELSARGPDGPPEARPLIMRAA